MMRLLLIWVSAAVMEAVCRHYGVPCRARR